MAIKKQERGKVLGGVDFFTVRQVPTYEGTGKKRRVKTSTVAIFHGKNRVKDGFGNLNQALDFIGENKYNKKERSFV